MLYLFIVSLVWAFSFGLIKGQLAGLDASFVAAVRLIVSLVVFLPLLRLRGVPGILRLRLFFIGAVQYGLMYIAYNHAFKYLQAYEVALFTIFTPLYVTLINDAYQRRFHGISLAATVLAIIGTAIVKEGSLFRPEVLTGFLVVQVSNIAFAFGQVDYKEALKRHTEVKDTNIFAILYLGGAAAAGGTAIFTTPWEALSVTGSQWLTLVYLGAVASGVCFFLWNVGARKVNTGTLAVFNDLKIPLAVTVSLLVFGEKTSLPHLLIGGGVVLAGLLLNEWNVKRTLVSAQSAAAD